jgi:hypothetical protein
MKKEYELIHILSRLTFKEEERELLKKILSENINWNEVFNVAIKNKVLPLIYYNLDLLGYAGYMLHNYRRNAMFQRLGNIERNVDLINEGKRVLKKLGKENILCTPLKGFCLIPNVYHDYGIRNMNDIDILIKIEDREKVTNIMNGLGYVQGKYNSSKKSIQPFSREKIMLWNMKMNNMPTFIKLSDCECTTVYEIDFSFDLDLQLSCSPVNEILDNAICKDGIHYLQTEAFFLQLCCHLYKEATNAEWVLESTDINFIKFCDVREYILHIMDEITLKKSVDLASKYGIQKSIYFTVYYLREIYHDGYENNILIYIDIDNEDFLNQYSKRNSIETLKWDQQFWDRLYSETNKSELDKMSGFYKKNSRYQKM